MAELLLGPGLVLVTWSITASVVLGYGRWLVVWVTGRNMTEPDVQWRMALWWGLSWITIMVLLINLWLPLGSSTSAWVILGSLALCVGVGVVTQRPRRPAWRPVSLPIVIWICAAATAWVYLALKALGPVSNYDSGLYHLGAVKYAYDYAAIPGLANLYFPFGYANAQFPLAAVLGNGPWDGIGYRLLNGALAFLLVIEVVSRLLNRRWTWGTWTLLIGLSASFIPLVAMADGLVTSPTADTSVMLLSFVSGAYLADFVQGRSNSASDAPTAALIALTTVLFRPTMVVFAAATVLVILVISWCRRRESPTASRSWIAVGILIGLAGVATLARDRVLSGWVLYPLSLLPTNVPWQAEDPTPFRIGTLAAARNPASEDGYVTAHSWDWLTAWFQRLPEQWETWFLLVGLAVLFALIFLAIQHHAVAGIRAQLFVLMAPSALAVTAWFVLSPPSFRFIWGPLFLLLCLPLGVLTSELSRSARSPWLRQRGTAFVIFTSATVIALVTVVSITGRNQIEQMSDRETFAVGPLALPYKVAPLPRPATQEVVLPDGNLIFTPRFGDQCWDNYPLCVYFTGQNIEFRGMGIQDGFAQSR